MVSYLTIVGGLMNSVGVIIGGNDITLTITGMQRELNASERRSGPFVFLSTTPATASSVLSF